MVEQKKICPSGWHVPSEEEWNTLTVYLGGEAEAGGKLKEADALHWLSPNTGASDEAGFTVLPAGGRTMEGLFNFLGENGSFWSTTKPNADRAAIVNFHYQSSRVQFQNAPESTGLPVRCVKN